MESDPRSFADPHSSLAAAAPADEQTSLDVTAAAVAAALSSRSEGQEAHQAASHHHQQQHEIPSSSPPHHHHYSSSMASTSTSDFEASAAAFAQLASYSAAQQQQQQEQEQQQQQDHSMHDDHNGHGLTHGDMTSASPSAGPIPHGSHHSHLVAESSASSHSGVVNNSPFAKHLGRNRACQACRERKLKCDGTRPICGQCNRAWQNRRKALDSKKASASEYELLDQPCTYLDLEPRQERKKSSRGGGKGAKAGKSGAKGSGSTGGAAKNTIAEVEKERQRLEAEVAALKSQLRQVETIRVKTAAHSDQGSASSPASGAALAGSSSGGVPMLGTGFQATSDELSIAEILANTMRGGDGPLNQRNAHLEYAEGAAQAGPDTGDFGMDAGGQGRIMMDPNLESLVGGFVGHASGSTSGPTNAQHDMTGAAALHHMHGPPNMTGTSIYHHPLNGSPQNPHHPQQAQQGGFQGHGVSQPPSQGRVGQQLEPMMLGAEKPSVAPSTASAGSGFSPGTAPTNIMSSGGSGGNTGEPDPMLELVFSGWPKDFPPPGAVDHLVSVFFDCCSFLPVFHPGRFFASLTHGPKSPQYPHHSVLHSMFALAYTLRPELDPVVPTPMMPQTRREKEAAMEVELQQRLADVMDANRPRDPRDQPRLAQHARDSRLDRERAKSGSAGYHSARAVEHIQRGTWEGGKIYDVCRAAILLCNKKYLCGELLDAWMTSAQSCRLSVALTLNWSRAASLTQKTSQTIDMSRLTLMAPPKDWIDEEERRYTMYSAFLTDRTAAATTLWAGSLVEEDVSVELPWAPYQAFLNSDPTGFEHAKEQNLHTTDLLTSNHLDSMHLMLKSMILLGRCGAHMSRLPANATPVQTRTAEFHKLNNSISAFTMSFPGHLSSALAQTPSGNVDPLLASAHALSHLCTLLLHDPMAHLSDESHSLCQAACAGVLNILRLLAAVGAELTHFPPIFSFTVATTGKNIVRRFRELEAVAGASANGSANGGGGNNGTEVGILRSEIDVILSSLCRIGYRWPLAMRQAQALARQLGMELTPELLGELMAPPQPPAHVAFENGRAHHQQQQQQQQQQQSAMHGQGHPQHHHSSAHPQHH